MQRMLKESLYATHEAIQPLKFWKFPKHKWSFAAKVAEIKIFVVYRFVSLRTLSNHKAHKISDFLFLYVICELTLQWLID